MARTKLRIIKADQSERKIGQNSRPPLIDIEDTHIYIRVAGTQLQPCEQGYDSQSDPEGGRPAYAEIVHWRVRTP